ncbi:hypothetical protein Pcinc_026184 [Petrolisthes cinctipes]|uniref:Lipocalin/cytosolic fatty-acid binding domain-containing protein n=1 Tax=Petrolisthes cinctipes TaxID=88211 RepID=A0AAE1KC09_PETCI|nr:hypothetical protein Pcinc_026184 [Petrolisthes cinctipes]
MANFSGTYKNDNNENLDAFLSQLGMNKMMRSIAVKGRPTMEVKVEGDEWTITISSSLKVVRWNFTLGEEVEVEGVEGKGKVVFTLEGNVLTQTPRGESRTTSVRTFTPEGVDLKLTHIPSDTVAYRHFKRQ